MMAVVMATSLILSPLTHVQAASDPKTGYLYGVGYREQELQQSKTTSFSSEEVGPIQYASYAGNTNIFIKGAGLHIDPDANLIMLSSLTFEGQSFLCPMLTLDDSFQSNPKNGMLSYRLPSIEKIFGLPEKMFMRYDSLSFELSILKIRADGSHETLKCKTSNNCRIHFRRYTSPVVYYVSPQYVYFKSTTNFYFNARYVPNYVKGLVAEDLPIVNAKIGNGRLDFENYLSH